PILDRVVEQLTRQLAESIGPRPDAPLFTGPRGGDLRYSWWRRTVLTPAREAVGVDATIHALRHSAGKALSNAGVPTVVLKSFMGHASAAFSIDVEASSQNSLRPAALVRPLGFEPRTCGLRVRCSAVELEARDADGIGDDRHGEGDRGDSN